MSATADMVARLRRMAAEPTQAPYTDAVLAGVIEQYPLIDAAGEEPDSSDWTPTYDLAAAAAQIWGEKAGPLAVNYDFSTAGQDFKRSQAYAQAMAQARYWQSRRTVKTIHLRVHPKANDADG